MALGGPAEMRPLLSGMACDGLAGLRLLLSGTARTVTFGRWPALGFLA